MGFEKMNSKVLKVPVGPGREVLARRGAMLGYTGDVRFSPVRSGGGSAGGFLGSQLSGESAAMMVAQGSGEVFYGFQGLTYAVVDLSGAEMLTVESNRLLVHDANLNSAIVPLTAQQSGGGFRAGLRSAATGAMTGQGMFTSQLSGVGSVGRRARTRRGAGVARQGRQTGDRRPPGVRRRPRAGAGLTRGQRQLQGGPLG